MNLYEQRFKNAIRFEMPDKTPLSCGDVILGLIADKEYTQGDNYIRPEWAMDKLIEGAKKFDSDVLPSFEYSGGMNLLMEDGSRYLMPGKDLPKNVGTQVIEHNLMDSADYYDFIIDKGWKAYVEENISVRLKDDDEAEFNRMNELNEIFAKKCEEADLFQYNMMGCTYAFNGGNYTLSMLRGFTDFLKDLRRIPEKVKSAISIINEYEIENYMAFSAETEYDTLWPCLARVDNNAMSRKMFESFVWPEILRFKAEADKKDLNLMIHADGNYADDVDLFCELTPKKSVIQFDGFTDVFSIANQLVEHKICVYGDIPPQILSFGSEKDVYDRCIALKRAMGAGLILSAGCSYPPNTRLENLWAMKKATEDMDF